MGRSFAATAFHCNRLEDAIMTISIFLTYFCIKWLVSVIIKWQPPDTVSIWWLHWFAHEKSIKHSTRFYALYIHHPMRYHYVCVWYPCVKQFPNINKVSKWLKIVFLLSIRKRASKNEKKKRNTVSANLKRVNDRHHSWGIGKNHSAPLLAQNNTPPHTIVAAIGSVNFVVIRKKKGLHHQPFATTASTSIKVNHRSC